MVWKKQCQLRLAQWSFDFLPLCVTWNPALEILKNGNIHWQKRFWVWNNPVSNLKAWIQLVISIRVGPHNQRHLNVDPLELGIWFRPVYIISWRYNSLHFSSIAQGRQRCWKWAGRHNTLWCKCYGRGKLLSSSHIFIIASSLALWHFQDSKIKSN